MAVAVQMTQIPEFDIFPIEVRPLDKGACRVSYLSEGGRHGLYLPASLLNGYTPKVGEQMLIKISVGGEFEQEVRCTSARPAKG